MQTRGKCGKWRWFFTFCWRRLLRFGPLSTHPSESRKHIVCEQQPKSGSDNRPKRFGKENIYISYEFNSCHDVHLDLCPHTGRSANEIKSESLHKFTEIPSSYTSLCLLSGGPLRKCCRRSRCEWWTEGTRNLFCLINRRWRATCRGSYDGEKKAKGSIIHLNVREVQSLDGATRTVEIRVRVADP